MLILRCIQGFINQFGSFNPSTKTYAISALDTSLLSSLAFIGKFIGCLAAGPAIERFGHRLVFLALSLISVIGIISEFSGSFSRHFQLQQQLTLSLVEITSAGTEAGSGHLAQFIIGRIVVYISVGLVEVDVTLALLLPRHTITVDLIVVLPEPIKPRSSQPLFVVSSSFLCNFFLPSAQLWQRASTRRILRASTRSAGRRSPAFNSSFPSVSTLPLSIVKPLVSLGRVTNVFELVIFVFTYFIPNSPRWLLSKDREEDANASLSRLRGQTYTAEGKCQIEIHAIKEALQESIHKAPWADLLRGTNFRRTMLVMVYYFFQQVRSFGSLAYSLLKG